MKSECMDQSSKEELQDFWKLGNNKVGKPLYLQVKGHHYPLDKNLGTQKKHLTPEAQTEVKLKPGQIMFHLQYDGERKHTHTYTVHA